MRHLTVLSLAFLVLVQATAAAPVELKLEPASGPDPAFKQNAGTVEIHGGMPVFATPASQPGPADQILELEYFCVGGSPAFFALPGPPFQAKTARKLPALGHSETWSTYTVRLAPAGSPLPAGWKQLRLDLTLPKDRVLQIRNPRIRPEREGEFDVADAAPAASAPKPALDAYLDKKFPGGITEVTVGQDRIHIEGNTGGTGGMHALADIPMDIVLDHPHSWKTMIDLSPDANGNFTVDVPRHRKRGGRDYDRLTSRWQIILKGEKGYEKCSHARYGGRIHCRAPKLPSAKPKNKKGLGGWGAGRIPGELAELGISAVTVNVMPHRFIQLEPGTGTVPTQWQGRTYHIKENDLAGLDNTFREARENGAMVSAILLVANPAKTNDPVVKMIAHPDAVKDGIFGMPNVTSEEGIGLYGAIINFMAERWSRPDGEFGRVHHWIVHNEVDAGWVWTNVGDKPAVVYMDLYQRSMRLTDLIARQYDPRSRAFISLTHHWAWHGAAHWYGSKLMTDLLVKFCEAEGDFPWAMAYHPYPQSLLNPRTWEDNDATFSFNTKKITPKNLEVLDAYMKQDRLRFRGKVRPVHLSENGFNSPDYSAKSLEDQAAGMALAWKKMAALSSIQSWQYHNWIDNRGEGGLKIGLRKFPDDKDDPLGKKPVWHLYKALGTPAENQACAPCLKTIGIQSWNEAIHRDPIH